ncbi:unnamed protein product [Cochlearia groenlandica]
MQQQQQSPQMFQMVPSISQTNITTDQIQKYLDENKKLILAIMENQNLGKLPECAQYQAVLQKNLMYLAAIADAQPPPPTPGAGPPPGAMPQQMTTPHPGMQPPSYFVQHPHALGMGQQGSPAGLFPPRGPLQFGGSPHQLMDPQQQQQQQQQQQLIHQQAMQGHMGIRPMGFNNNNNNMMQQPETALGGSGANVGHRGGKQDGSGGALGKDDGK